MYSGLFFSTPDSCTDPVYPTHINKFSCVVNHSLELNRIEKLPVKVAVGILCRWLYSDVAAVNAPNHPVEGHRPCHTSKSGSHSHQLLVCGMVDRKKGRNLRSGGVDGMVEGCLWHVESPGDDMIGCTTSQPEQGHQAGNFRVQAVICVTPHGFH